MLRPSGAFYTTHMRDEAEHVLDSLDESFHVGETAQVPVVISHHKTTGMRNFGRTAETLPKIAAAIQKQEIGLDAYPYVASSTVLRTERLEDATRVLITWSKAMPEQAGRDLADIAKEWGVGLREAAQRPRRPRRGRLCGPHGVRPRDRHRPRDLCRADPAGGRYCACFCQRPAGVDSGQSFRGARRPRAPPPAHAGRGALIRRADALKLRQLCCRTDRRSAAAGRSPAHFACPRTTACCS